jgi:hypothetical protein
LTAAAMGMPMDDSWVACWGKSTVVLKATLMVDYSVADLVEPKVGQ